MNTQVTRPGHLVPGWSVEGMSASKRELAAMDREERDARALTNIAGASLAMAIAAAFVWIALAFAPHYDTQPALGYVPGLEGHHAI